MRRKLPLFAALAVVVLGVAACCISSDDSTSSTPATSSSGAATSTTSGSANAATGDPIIELICSCSGHAAGPFRSVSDFVTAWETDVNANGGINGHPVKVTIADDAGDAGKAQAAAKKLIEQDKVMAIVGEQSLQDTAFQKYVESKAIPVIGGAPYGAPMFTSPMFFPTGTGFATTIYALAAEAKKDGRSKYSALYCAEAPVVQACQRCSLRCSPISSAE